MKNEAPLIKSLRERNTEGVFWPQMYRLLVFFTLFIAAPFIASAKEMPAEKGKVIVFHSLTCHACVKVIHEFMPKIQEQFGDRISIEYREISDIKNYKSLLELQGQYRVSLRNELPVVFFKGNFLTGEAEIRKKLYRLIDAGPEKLALKGNATHVDLISYFLKFSPLAVASAGLIDGVNPCAFAIIVFFISFLALQGYRKKELILIGLCFIFAVFLTYLLMGLGFLGFFYRLSGFWLTAKIINISIGWLSLILGCLALYDFFKFKKTGDTETLLLQLPKAIKRQVHSVIGMRYRKSKEPEAENIKVHILKLTLGALVTGFLVSILEAVCTGQVYLPTITFVLKTTHVKLQALSYLLLYNFMFIVPLLAVFIFALLGITSAQFSQVFKKHLLTVKILMAVLFLSLGIFLIWRA